jgi:hypothetical protein
MYGIRQQDFQGYEFLERNLELSLKIKFDFISFVDKSPELTTLLTHALLMYSVYNKFRYPFGSITQVNENLPEFKTINWILQNTP